MRRWLAVLLLSLFVLAISSTARADAGGATPPAPPKTAGVGPCTATRADMISLVGSYVEFWGNTFDASPARQAQVKTWIYLTVQRESGTNQCRPDGGYVMGDHGRSVGVAQLFDGGAWNVWDNPYRSQGLDGRYDAETNAAFISWWAFRYGNLCPWWTPAAPFYMCKR